MVWRGTQAAASRRQSDKWGSSLPVTPSANCAHARALHATQARTRWRTPRAARCCASGRVSGRSCPAARWSPGACAAATSSCACGGRPRCGEGSDGRTALGRLRCAAAPGSPAVACRRAALGCLASFSLAATCAVPSYGRHLEDGTLEVLEPRELNSGLPQGRLLRRHRWVHVCARFEAMTGPDMRFLRFQDRAGGLLALKRNTRRAAARALTSSGAPLTNSNGSPRARCGTAGSHARRPGAVTLAHPALPGPSAAGAAAAAAAAAPPRTQRPWRGATSQWGRRWCCMVGIFTSSAATRRRAPGWRRGARRRGPRSHGPRGRARRPPPPTSSGGWGALAAARSAAAALGAPSARRWMTVRPTRAVRPTARVSGRRRPAAKTGCSASLVLTTLAPAAAGRCACRCGGACCRLTADSLTGREGGCAAPRGSAVHASSTPPANQTDAPRTPDPQASASALASAAARRGALAPLGGGDAGELLPLALHCFTRDGAFEVVELPTARGARGPFARLLKRGPLPKETPAVGAPPLALVTARGSSVVADVFEHRHACRVSRAAMSRLAGHATAGRRLAEADSDRRHPSRLPTMPGCSMPSPPSRAGRGSSGGGRPDVYTADDLHIGAVINVSYCGLAPLV
jgi:hypothetical protein